MSLDTILSTLESHIKEYEAAVTNALANFHGVSGGLAALQRTLGVIAPLVEELVPASAPILDVVDAVVTDINTLGTSGAESAVVASAQAPVAA
jgi:hypothetical protein